MRMLALMLMLVVSLMEDVSPTDEPRRDPPVAGLAGSKHDFSGESWTGGDRCIACHFLSRDDFPAPAPLWNPSADFNRAFGDALQDSPSGSPSLPGNGTLACLRCHDGTVASDMFGSLAAPAGVNKRHPSLASTAHGSTNHPVGIEYPQFDPEYRPMHMIESEGQVPLPGGRIECISCHDPHNAVGAPHMLTKTNQRSALCLTCHMK